MAMDRSIKRGDIYYANLDPVVGSEQGGVRPVLIIQNNTGNLFSPTVIVAAITSKTDKKQNQPTHIPIECSGLAKSSMALMEQIRTIDKQRLNDYVGRLNDENMVCVDKGLMKSFGL